MIDIQTIKRFAPFDGMDEEYLKEALKQIRVKKYPKGAMLFKRGKDLDERFYLISGQVDLIDSAYYVSSIKSDQEKSKHCLNPDSPAKTKCSAVAKMGEVVAFAIDIQALDRILAWSQSAKSMSLDEDESISSEFGVEEIHGDSDDWMSSLLQAPLFSRIPLSQVQELFIRFETVKVKRGDRILKEGDKGDYFYVVAAGKARVWNRTGGIDLILKQGKYFGEEALLGNTVRNANVTMETNGIIKRLNSEDFMSLLKTPVLQYVENGALDKIKKPYKLIDVKLPMEYRMHHVPGSINVPLSRLRSTLAELGESSIYVVPDDAGSRADIAAHLLCQAGFDALILRAS